MFSCEFCGISKNTFFTEYLRATASWDFFDDDDDDDDDDEKVLWA